MTFQFHSRKAKPLAWLPNTAGYLFTGIKHDGSEVRCRVTKNPATGMHSVKGLVQDVTYQDLRGWKE